jgi:2-polyprenyl-6-methoxyphenol hydroxylase-like FAD-dependent oxidoreductase
MKRRAIIIGGSMSGLFSAAFLRQIGWDVDVYELKTSSGRAQHMGGGTSGSTVGRGQSCFVIREARSGHGSTRRSAPFV